MTTPHPTATDSLWLHERERRGRWSDRRTESSDQVPHRADVVVVGAGIAGLLTAWRLRETGRSVVVLEAADLASRTTGHSTAKIAALHGAVYHRLATGKSPEEAAAYAQAQQQAVTEYRQLVTDHGIDCGFTDAVAYTVASTPDGVAQVEAEVTAAVAAGLGAYLTTDTELATFGLDVTACALGGQAHLDPVAFCDGLAALLRERQVPIVERTRVTAVDESRDGWCTVTLQPGEAGDGTADADDDRSIRADQVVFATHLPVVDPALLAGRVRPERSYVLSGSTDRGPDAMRGMYLSIDEGYSIRPADGGERPALVVSGEGHRMTDDVESTDHVARLADWAAEHLGVAAEHHWSAFDYVTTDGVPFIGRLAPGSSRRFVATGFAKWGFTNAMVAARLLTDQIDGRPAHPLFDATRLLPTVGRDLVSNNAQVAKRFVVDRVRSTTTRAELAPGDGAVVREGLHHVARARGLDGHMYELDATCTHLGCIVQFDQGEQTWNCPCHGSRFALDGTVLDGPAITPLQMRAPDDPPVDDEPRDRDETTPADAPSAEDAAEEGEDRVEVGRGTRGVGNGR